MMRILILLGLAIATQGFPSQPFDDGGFQPIAPPIDAVPRGRSLSIHSLGELQTSASGVSPIHSEDGIGAGTKNEAFRGRTGTFNLEANPENLEVRGKRDGFDSDIDQGGFGSGGKGNGFNFGGNQGGFDSGGKGIGFNFGGNQGGFGSGGKQGGIDLRGNTDGFGFGEGSQIHGSGRDQFRGGNLHHGGPGPTKTIYVNVPNEQSYESPKPLFGGPPRKHYRIVFIKSPAPPPLRQPILPPRLEQKTLIYVLHPKAESEQQKLIEIPENIQHDPEVYFIKYEDKPPTPEELQNLVKDSIDEHSPSDIDLTGSNSNPSQYPFLSQEGNSLKSAGSGILKAKSIHKGYDSQPLLLKGEFSRPQGAPGLSSSILQGIGGINGLPTDRYQPTPKQPQNNVKFEGPFARSRYERSQSYHSTRDGKQIGNAGSFPFDKIPNRD